MIPVILDNTLREKLARTQASLRELGSVLVAFSAGADSTFLLALAVQVLGRGRVLGAIGVSPSLAGRERESAIRRRESSHCSAWPPGRPALRGGSELPGR